MNCREAENRIFAERDGTLDDNQRAALVSHLDQCAGCRRTREQITTALASLRAATETTRVPEPERAWQDLRRTLRQDRAPAARAWLGWLALPAAAAAALAIAFLGGPAERVLDSQPAPQVARAKVEASVENASPVVFVDDKSGWVFVWAATGDPKHI